MVTIKIQEFGSEPKEVMVLRVPCEHEWIDVDGVHYHVTSVHHTSGESPSACCMVMRSRQEP